MNGNIALKKLQGYDNREEGTMEKVKEIANSIHESIVVKVDYPSKHENNRLPVLDMEFWIEEVEINGVQKHQILYSHYMKPVSSRYVVHKDSAIPYRSKINVLTNDLLRVMKNVSPLVGNEERNHHIQYFMHRLQFSGYSKSERILIYKRTRSRFQQYEEKVRLGEIPAYRSKFWNLHTRREEKRMKQANWYKKGGYQATFFVDASPKGELAQKCQSLLRSCQLPIKVIEKRGKSVKEELVKSDPFKCDRCSDENCPICVLDSGINCKARDVVYQHKCSEFETCNGMYIGETSSSIKERTHEHIQNCKYKSKNSAHFGHNTAKHNGVEQKLEIKIIRRCQNDPMLRQCMEALVIKDLDPEINRCQEWGNRKKNPTAVPTSALQ